MPVSAVNAGQHDAVADDVRDLGDEVVACADLETHPEVVADEDDIEHVGGQLVRVAARIRCDADPFGTDGQQHLVAGRAALHVERVNDAAIRLDLADLAVRRDDGAGKEVVLADEVGDERTFRFFVEGLRRRDLFDASSAKHRDPVRHHHGFLLVVCDVDHGDAEFAMDAADLELHFLAQAPVEGAERFVHQHQFRLEHQRPGNRHPLLLAAGQLPRPAVLETVQLDEAQCAPYAPGPFVGWHATYLQREGQVAAHGHVRKQRVVLEHDTDTALVRRQVVYGLAIDQDRPGGRLLEAGKHHEARGLARSGGSKQGQELAFLDGEVEVLDHHGPTVVALLDVAIFDVRRYVRHGSPHHHLSRRTGRYRARASINGPGRSSTMMPSTCSRRTKPSPWAWRRYLRSVSK